MTRSSVMLLSVILTAVVLCLFADYAPARRESSPSRPQEGLRGIQEDHATTVPGGQAESSNTRGTTDVDSIDVSVTCVGRPVSGANIDVRATGFHGTTQGDGKAVIPLPPFPIALCVSKGGHYTTDVTIEPTTRRVVVRLESLDSALGGRVFLPNGRAAVSAHVRFSVPDRCSSVLDREQVTTSQGLFTVSVSPPFVVEAIYPGYAPVRRLVTDANDLPLRLELKNGPTIEGVVVDADGRACPRVDVFALLIDEPGLAVFSRALWEGNPEHAAGLDMWLVPWCKTDADGYYRITGLRRERYVALAIRPGVGIALSDECSLAQRQFAWKDLRFPIQGELLVRVDSSTGERPRHLSAVLTRAGGVPRGPDSDSPYPRFVDLEFDEYALELVAPGFVGKRTTVNITSSERQVLHVRLVRGLTLRGRVTDTRGKGIGGIAVSVGAIMEAEAPWSQPLFHHVTRTDPSGAFGVTGISRHGASVVVNGGASWNNLETVTLHRVAADRRLSVRLQPLGSAEFVLPASELSDSPDAEQLRVCVSAGGLLLPVTVRTSGSGIRVLVRRIPIGQTRLELIGPFLNVGLRTIEISAMRAGWHRDLGRLDLRACQR